MSEIQDFRLSAEDKIDALTKELHSLHIRDTGREVANRREVRNQQRQLVLNQLSAPNYREDYEHAAQPRRQGTSGNWVLSEPAFKEWSDLESTSHKALYLSGIPGSGRRNVPNNAQTSDRGTGKTVLTSGIISHLENLKLRKEAHGKEISVLYFYFKHSQSEKRTLKGMLLGLISQLLNQDDIVADLVYQGYSSSDQAFCSQDRLSGLATTCLKSQRLCFIILDGLDECAEAAEDDVIREEASVIDWFEALISGDGSDSPEDVGFNIRLLISGQRDGFLDKRLLSYLSIQLETNSGHQGDIRAYARAKCTEISAKFRLSTDQLNETVERVTEGARGEFLFNLCFYVSNSTLGMFLYSKVVLNNLLAQISPYYLKRELSTDNFPKGLDQA